MQDSSDSKSSCINNTGKPRETNYKYESERSSGSQSQASYNSSQTIDEAESSLKLYYSPDTGESCASRDQHNNSQYQKIRSYDGIISSEAFHSFDGQFQFSGCFSSGSNSINQKILKLQQLSSSKDKFGQLGLLQEINQYFLMGYDENLASVNFRGLVTCLIGIIDCSSQSSLEIESFYDENTMVELKSIAIGLLIHLIEGVPRTVGDLLAPVIPLFLTTMSNSFIADILDRMLSLLDHLSKNYPKHILRCGGLQTIIGFYDFVTASQHRTILNLINNCFSSLTNEDIPTIIECLPQMVLRFRDPEPRCVEKVCQCFLKIVSCYQFNSEILDKIANSQGFLENIQHLLLSSPPLLSNNLELIQILTIITRSSPILAIKLIQTNLVDTINNFISGMIQIDKSCCLLSTTDENHESTTKTTKSISHEEINEVVKLISHLMPHLKKNQGEITFPHEPCEGYNLRSNSTPETVPSCSSKVVRHSKSKKRNSNANLPSSKRIATNSRTNDPKQAFFLEEIEKIELKLSVLTNDEKFKLDLTMNSAVNSIDKFLPILLKIYPKCEDEKSRLKCLSTIEEVLTLLKTHSMDLIIDKNPQIYSLLSNIMITSSKELITTKGKSTCKNSSLVLYMGLTLIYLLCERMQNFKTASLMRKQGIIYYIKKIISDNDLIITSMSQSINSHQKEKDSILAKSIAKIRNSLDDDCSSTNESAYNLDNYLNYRSVGEFSQPNTDCLNYRLINSLRRKSDLQTKEQTKVHLNFAHETMKENIVDICTKLDNLMNKIFEKNSPKPNNNNNPCDINLLPKMSELARKISSSCPKKWQEAIHEMVTLFSGQQQSFTDQLVGKNMFPSPFELEHSGFLTALFNYLSPDGQVDYPNRLRIFRDNFFPELFSDYPLNFPRFITKRICNCSKAFNHIYDPCDLCECQLEYGNLDEGNISKNLKISPHSIVNINSSYSSFRNLIKCLLDCLHQHDKFDLFVGTEFLLASGHSSLVNLQNIQSSHNQLVNTNPFSLTPDPRSQLGYRLVQNFGHDNPNIYMNNAPTDLVSFKMCTGNTISQLAAKTKALSNSPLNNLGGLLKIDLIREPSDDPEHEKIFLKNSYWTSLIHPLSIKVPATYTIQQLQNLLINRVYLMDFSSCRPTINHSRFDMPTVSQPPPPSSSSNSPMDFEKYYKFQTTISDHVPITNLTNNTPPVASSSSTNYCGLKSFMNKTRSSKLLKQQMPINSRMSSDPSGSSCVVPNPVPEIPRRNSIDPSQLPEISNVRLLRSNVMSFRKAENSSSSSDELNLREQQQHNNKGINLRQQNTSKSFQEQEYLESQTLVNNTLSSRSPQNIEHNTQYEPVHDLSASSKQNDLMKLSTKKNRISLLAAINKISSHVNSSQPNSRTEFNSSFNSQRSISRKKDRQDKSKIHSMINGIFESNETPPSSSQIRKQRRGLTKKAISSMLQDKLVPIFYLDGERLDGEMPVFQALRSKMPTRVIENEMNLTAADIINVFMWSKSHLLSYKLILKDSLDPKKLQKKSKGDSSIRASLKKTKLTRSSGGQRSSVTTIGSSSVLALLNVKLKDPLCNYVCKTNKEKRILKSLGSLDHSNCVEKKILEILRYFNLFNEAWIRLDGHLNAQPLINEESFISQELTNKVSQQLNDVFSLLTGNWPIWLVQLLTSYPFLFNFSVRQAFFYAYNFNRSRLLLRLSDSLSSTESQGSSSPISLQLNGHQFRQIMVLSSLKDLSCSQFLNQNSIKTIESLLVTHSINNSPYVPNLNLNGNLPALHKSVNPTSSTLNDSRNRLSQIASSMFGFQDHHNHPSSSPSGKFTEDSPNDFSPMTTEVINSSNKFKASIGRNLILSHAIDTFELMGSSQSFLEIAFNGEAGFGVGPTLEFYTLVSHQLQRYQHKLWHGNDVDSDDNYIVPANGLFPRPNKNPSKDDLKKFTFIGRLMARSILDSRQIDVPFSQILYKWFLQEEESMQSLNISDLEFVDAYLSKQINYLVSMANQRNFIKSQLVFKQDDSKQSEEKVLSLVSQLDKIDEEINGLCLTFVLPGYDDYELMDNGKKVDVTGTNLTSYIKRVVENFLNYGVLKQMEALINGFDEILPNSRGILSKLFIPKELDLLFCGHSFELWDVENLKNSCKYDHGYTVRSRSIQFLFEIMAEFSSVEKRLFVQFITGSPRLPIGGFKALKPPLKIVLKYEAKDNVDSHLPSVMTCQNYLKLPDYSSKEVMREKLIYAINEGQNAFLLS